MIFGIALRVRIITNRPSLIADIVIGHVTMLSLPCGLDYGPQMHQADTQTLCKHRVFEGQQVADGQQLTILY